MPGVAATEERAKRPDKADSEKDRVITKAVLNAAKALKLSGQELADIIGVSQATLTRLKNQKSVLREGSKDQEMALYLIRVFRSLGALYGGNMADMARWLRAENRALRAAPVDTMKHTAGLVRTMDYLDRFRAKV